MRTSIYVDGFNLYFGALKGTPYRWLDVAAMCRFLLAPVHQITQIRYFTATVLPRPHDPQQPIRQQTYLRALQTLPYVSIIYGTFLSHVVEMPRADSPTSPPEMVRVIKTEEKGSDVNLATYLVKDGYENAYECAVVVSNDSDLVEPIKVVRDTLKKVVGVIVPHKRPSAELRRYATFTKKIRQPVLAASQLPSVLQDAQGTFHKPATW
ncbi:MAG: NYN domain-containing protein [Candidatus Latescibacteria bacterium]|nr:NYN domain-containing protein [Candidatus Latescibacterota bacterium]